MQKQQTTTTQITIPAGAVYQVADVVCRAQKTFTATVDTAHTYHGAVVGYSFARGEMPCYVEARHVQPQAPEPTPEPTPRQARPTDTTRRIRRIISDIRAEQDSAMRDLVAFGEACDWQDTARLDELSAIIDEMELSIRAHQAELRAEMAQAA